MISGAFWAVFAGVGFGFFQAFNRKAGRGMGDAYRATFILLAVSALILVTASLAGEDVRLLKDLSLRAYLNFGLAGFVHFFLGWTFITISQVRIGAARTGALVGATPLFATIVGVLFFDEFLSLPVFLGIAIVLLGVYFVSWERASLRANNGRTLHWRDSVFGLATAVCFAASAIFIRAGLAELDSPLLGVTIGMVISAGAYGIGLLVRRRPSNTGTIERQAMVFQILAGIFVGFSTWMRWIALDMAPVGVVLSLGRLNIPVVLIVAPLIVGRQNEQVTPRVWSGAVLTIIGSLLLIFY